MVMGEMGVDLVYGGFGIDLNCCFVVFDVDVMEVVVCVD